MTWSTEPLPPDWPRTAKRILTRDNYRCHIAGCRRRATEVDHVIPRSQGGTHDDSNLAAICTYHHRRKTAQEANEARRRRYDPRRKPEPHPGLVQPNRQTGVGGAPSGRSAKDRGA